MLETVQIWCGDKGANFRNYEYCMDQIREMFPNYERIFIPEVENEHPIITTDTLRNELACKRPNMLYIDDDIVFNEVPKFDFKDGQPYFGTAHGKVNHCLFYVNENMKFFKDIFKEKEQRNIQTVFGWPIKIIRTKKVNIIDTELYMHFRFTSTAREALIHGNHTSDTRSIIGSYEDEDGWD